MHGVPVVIVMLVVVVLVFRPRRRRLLEGGVECTEWGMLGLRRGRLLLRLLGKVVGVAGRRVWRRRGRVRLGAWWQRGREQARVYLWI